MELKFLPAFNGESILISFIDPNGIKRNILVDGGISITYRRVLKPLFDKLIKKGEYIDLLIVTHIDDDHIGGIKELFQDVRQDKSFIKKVWFNSGEALSQFFNQPHDKARDVGLVMNDGVESGTKSGVTLENELKKLELWSSEIIHNNLKPIEFFGTQITILSPSNHGISKLNDKWETDTNQEVNSSSSDDYEKSVEELSKLPFKTGTSTPNLSSIAFLLEYKGKTVLLTGDSCPTVLTTKLIDLGYSKDSKLKLDLFNISHHGSKKNTNYDLLSLIECSQYAVCTDGKQYGFPHKEALSRIVTTTQNSHIYFNYDEPIEKIFTQDEIEKSEINLHSLALLNHTFPL